MQNPLIVPVKVLRGHKVQGELGMLNIYQTSGRFLCIRYGGWQILLSNLVFLRLPDIAGSPAIFFFFLCSGLSNLTRVRVLQ